MIQEKIRQKIEFMLGRSMGNAGMRESAAKYLERSAAYSCLAGIFSWFVLGLFTGKIIFSAFLAFCAGAAVLALFLSAPLLRAKKTAALFERDLPFALGSMAVELNLRVQFETCIENIAKGKYGIVSGEFAAALEEVKRKGSSLQEAMLHLSEKIDSLMVKRAVSQLVNIYEQGASEKVGEPVKRIALEMLSRQKAVSKEFSGKLVVFSLLFIAISAIIPAIFQAYIIVGSLFLKLKFTAMQVFLIAAVGFPLLDLAILLYIRSKTPVFLRG